ncbi:hypothetical protein RHGRI_006839 [Rhododendron griersonianum]|uniref:Uncharacterized protein n=1 Tax=Rhododendron griersonianum TaxID=479676 RepID=A0AAV6KUN0_9ERIC|nr:hypothetical protein RHGRI_006839 [Rhododendron griersonianum]
MATVATRIAGGRSFSGWTNIAFTSRSFSSYFSQQLGEEQQPLSLYHAIYEFVLPVLTSFLKLKYQGLDSTPFETHPKIMFVAIAGLLLYSLAYDYELRLISSTRTPPAYANVLLCGAAVLGSLPLVSLASVIFPDPIRPVLFLLYVLFSAAVVMVNFRLVQVPWWNCNRRRTRSNLATPQRRIRRAPIHSSSSAAPHSYTGRERLPVLIVVGFHLLVSAFPVVARAAAFAMISPASVFHVFYGDDGTNLNPMATVATTIAGGRSFSGRTNIAFTSRRFSSYFSQQLGEEQRSLSLYHAIYEFVLPILISFLKLKYQGLDSTPFETHPKTMFVSIASLLLYSLAYDYALRLSSSMSTPPAYANVLLCGAVVLGSLPLVSLASVIFPDSIRPVLFLLYVLFSAGVIVSFRLVQVPWNYIRRSMRGNLATPQRQTGRALIYSSSSMAHGYIGREGLPV